MVSVLQQLNINPELIPKSLFNSCGTDWKRLGTIMSPTFSASKLKVVSVNFV